MGMGMDALLGVGCEEDAWNRANSKDASQVDRHIPYHTELDLWLNQIS